MPGEEANDWLLDMIQRRKTMLECQLVTAPECLRGGLREDIKACGQLLVKFERNFRKQRERDDREHDLPAPGALLN